MKSILSILLVAFMFLISGCGDSKTDKISDKISEIDKSKSDDKNYKKNSAEYFDEKRKEEIENLTHNEAQKNATPIKSMDYNISVQKDEMDKLKLIASDYRWTEKEVREAVIILKNCGIDFSRIKRIRSHSTVSNGYELYLNKNENEATELHSLRTIVCIKLNGNKPSNKNDEVEKRKISEVYGELDTLTDSKGFENKQFYCMYVNDGNTEKIVGSFDNLCMSNTVYKKIADQLNNFINSRNGRLFARSGEEEKVKIPFKWHYDFNNRKIYYEVNDEIELPSEVYGVDFERYDRIGNFDYKGDLIGNIQTEKRR